jgi:hypothetical protein
MSDVQRGESVLRRECEAWSRYLVGAAPSSAVVARYVDAHAQGVVESAASSRAFDRALVRLARGGTMAARACDVHARLFRPSGLLRRKLVLALALLEVDAASHERIDVATAGSRAGLVLRVGLEAVLFALLAGAGLLLFVPLRIACGLVGEPARSA